MATASNPQAQTPEQKKELLEAVGKCYELADVAMMQLDTPEETENMTPIDGGTGGEGVVIPRPAENAQNPQSFGTVRNINTARKVRATYTE